MSITRSDLRDAAKDQTTLIATGLNELLNNDVPLDKILSELKTIGQSNRGMLVDLIGLNLADKIINS